MKDIVIKNFSNEIEARLAKAKLEVEGIKSVIQIIGFTGFGDSAVPSGETVLRVLEKNVEKAKEILEIK